MEKANMKKVLLSVFAAVMLGVGIMLFPYWTFFRIYGESPIGSADTVPYLKPMSASENWANYARQRTEGIPTNDGTYKVQIQSKPADASLQMITIGFIVALVAYVIVRRKSSRPTYLPSVRIPPY
jgi:hypothetical protein